MLASILHRMIVVLRFWGVGGGLYECQHSLRLSVKTCWVFYYLYRCLSISDVWTRTTTDFSQEQSTFFRFFFKILCWHFEIFWEFIRYVWLMSRAFLVECVFVMVCVFPMIACLKSVLQPLSVYICPFMHIFLHNWRVMQLYKKVDSLVFPFLTWIVLKQTYLMVSIDSIRLFQWHQIKFRKCFVSGTNTYTHNVCIWGI